jgi:hypothetical protein
MKQCFATSIKSWEEPKKRVISCFGDRGDESALEPRKFVVPTHDRTPFHKRWEEPKKRVKRQKGTMGLKSVYLGKGTNTG